MIAQATNAGSTDSAFSRLYKLAGLSAWGVAALTLAEVILFALYPQPATVRDWFALFQRNRLMGLLEFWGLEVPMYLLFALVFLALYLALRNVDPGLMLIALALALLGIGIFLATNNPFGMLSLSNQYAAAASEAQRSALLAAGETLLVNTNQRAVGGFNLGLFLVSMAGVIAAALMFRSTVFSRSAAILGLLAHGLSLADYLRQALTSSVVLALLVILPNALFLVIWYALVGRRLMKIT